MKKQILTLSFLALSFVAFSQNNSNFLESNLKFGPEDRLFVGLGINSYESPYLGDKNYVEATPLFYYQTERIIINGGEIYAPLFKYFGLRGQYRIDGKGSADINDTEYKGNKIDGIGIREDAFEAGLYVGVLGFSLSYLADFTDIHKGSSFNLDIGGLFRVGDFEINPRLKLSFQDEKMTRYYYGVSAAESQLSGLDLYQPESSTVANYGLNLFYYFTPQWSLVAIYDIYVFSDEIKDSPIVTRNSSSAVIGLAYHFF